MIKIDKSHEPDEWTRIRKTPGIDFDSADKDALREALLVEQGHICGYCMRRIDFVRGRTTDTRIEHVKPQSHSLEEGNIDETMDYSNMILCCNGDIEGNNDEKKFHCDRSRKNKPLSCSPLDLEDMKTISYSSKDGRVKSSNEQYDKEINDILNLNHPLLAANRLAALKGLIVKLGERKDWRDSELKHVFDEYLHKNADGKYHEYCGILTWFLRKRLTKRT
jgi:uncharacterized protein (TIGR02646 family)